jgi:PKD repeat protein
MFIVFMVSRLCRVSVVAGLVLVSALLTVGCQKVPLLAPSGSTITLIASATALPINGTADLIAQVIEPSGTPPQHGTRITFSTTLGSIQPFEAETDIAGRAAVKFLAGGGSGTATITAISGGASASGSNAVKIAIGAAAVASISASASPGTVPASGGTSTITAKIGDSSGNPLAGVPVTFTADNGSLSASVVTSDAAGVAQATLTTNKTTKVTVTAGVATPSTGTGSIGATVQTATVTVNVNAASTIADGAASPPNPAVGQAVTFPITFTQNANGSPVARVVVDFGDGTSQTINGQPSAVTHVYFSPGSYTVRVTAIDTFGDTANGTGSVTVTPKPQLVVTISATTPNPTAGMPTSFTIAATPTTGNAITSVTVDFGDGTKGTLPGNTTSVQHVYTTGGTYAVTAVATDSSGATGSASTVIFVGSAPVASFTVTPASPTRGQPAQFDGSASTSSRTIVSYAWTFGDGTTGSGVTVSHTYSLTLMAGPYTVTLTITDSANQSASTSRQITVQ